jgi:hypothetical protein
VTTGDPPDDNRTPPKAALPAPADRALVRRAQETRERVIARLSDHFAHDVLDVDEFERRVTVAQTADNLAEIEALIADLQELEGAAPPAPAVVPRVVTDLALAGGQDRETLHAIFGGIERRGTWTVPRRLKIVATFGGAVSRSSCRPAWRCRCTVRRSSAGFRTSIARPPTPTRRRRCCACAGSRCLAG